MERGAKAYAPFGAGRKTGHQEPVVAARGRKRRGYKWWGFGGGRSRNAERTRRKRKWKGEERAARSMGRGGIGSLRQQ